MTCLSIMPLNASRLHFAQSVIGADEFLQWISINNSVACKNASSGVSENYRLAHHEPKLEVRISAYSYCRGRVFAAFRRTLARPI